MMAPWMAPCPSDYMQASVDRYVQHGILTSQFLRALFSNDLKGAFGAADDRNAASMRDWVRWMYTEMPARSQGSPEKVAAWIAERQTADVEGAA